MRKRLLALALMLLAAAAGAQAPDLAKMDLVLRALPDGPVALVDGKPIAKEDFIALYMTQLARLSQQEDTDDLADEVRVRLGIRCLGELIRREILANTADDRGIAIPDAEVLEVYHEEMDFLKRGYERTEGKPATEDDLLALTGQTRGEALEQIRTSLKVDKARDAIAAESATPVLDSEVEKFYEQRSQLFDQGASVRLRQILVRPFPNANDADEAAWSEAKRNMEEALARIDAGETFDAVAKDVSDAPDADRGGDMGLVPNDELPPFYREPLADMEPGQRSRIIRSRFGLHVFRLEERTGAGKISLEEARPRIERALRAAKRETAVEAYCQPIINDTDRVKVFFHIERVLTSSRALNSTSFFG